MKLINFYGGPGSGKSSIAASLFGYMKSKHYNVELVTEYAKDKVYENSLNILNNQVYIFGKQFQRIFRLEDNNIDYVILDSPLLLSIVYNQINGGKFTNLNSLVHEIYERYYNINFYLYRNVNYNNSGRLQTEDEAKGVDQMIQDLFDLYDIDHHKIFNDLNMESLLKFVLKG
jgi:tRNA uridine 5-carbamoylmethylation protein Kti12